MKLGVGTPLSRRTVTRSRFGLIVATQCRGLFTQGLISRHSRTKNRKAMETLETEQKSPPPTRWFIKLRAIVLVPMCIVVVWGGVLRGELTHFFAGIAVVRRDGSTRNRCSWDRVGLVDPTTPTGILSIATTLSDSSVPMAKSRTVRRHQWYIRCAKIAI